MSMYKNIKQCKAGSFIILMNSYLNRIIDVFSNHMSHISLRVISKVRCLRLICISTLQTTEHLYCDFFCSNS